MKCALIRWWMEEYIDGTLQGRRLQWFERHLKQCRACAQELAWHHSLRDALRAESLSAPPQDMWQDFQRRLAERRPTVRASRTAWWQWGTATAAITCALVLAIVWRSARTPVSVPPVLVEQPVRQNIASADRQLGAPASEGTESPVSAPAVRSPAVAPVHRVQTHPVRRPQRLPTPVRVAAQPLANRVQETAPRLVASMAYAEVRNEQGELVGKVLLQTTYDENGQPRAVQIECDTPAAVEVESNGESMDRSDTYSDDRGAAGSPAPTAGTHPGLSD